ncbi:conserved hypothetical protein [Haloferula helveola]|uniref:Uncharacterized protein n=1 Tax=Haloferula helveola TaxID=490095 RepID=A0ABM7REP4_9BACT|nr:conserved hypothetical protein [Haloferula helveola]
MGEQNAYSVHSTNNQTKSHYPLTIMTIRTIIGENGPQAELCNGGQCPAVILTEEGNAYVQGNKLSTRERESLSAPEGEDFVSIPFEVLRAIAAQVSEA